MRIESSLIGIVASMLILVLTACEKPKLGCMNPDFQNYDSDATEDNGCCCNRVEYNGHGSSVYSERSQDYPNVPDSVIAQIGVTPFARAFVTIRRDNFRFDGPCGCYYLGWISGYSYPREVCTTDLFVTVVFRNYGHEYWSLIADMNFAGVPMIRLGYNVAYEVPGGEAVSLSFSDTLTAIVPDYTSAVLSKVLTVPCPDVPVDGNVVVEISDMEFL